MTEKKKLILKISAVVLVLVIALTFNFLWHTIRFSVFTGRVNTYKAAGTTAPQQGEPNTLTVPSLKITAPIVYINEATETVFQKALQNGVVHYPGTAKPGEAGNCYIFGHSSDYIWSEGNYKTVLALLPQIEIGDEVIISDTSGKQFTYTVTKSFVASPKDVHLLGQGDKTKKILTLQTSYPLGTALKRWIVVAEIK